MSTGATSRPEPIPNRILYQPCRRRESRLRRRTPPVMRRALLSAGVVLTLALSVEVAIADPDPVGLGQRFGQGVVNQAGADCRIVDNADSQCSSIDNRDIDQAQISAYEP